MADPKDLYDLGPAANPIDASDFEAKRKAWYADRDRMISEVLPEVTRAITELESTAELVNNIVSLGQQLLPLLIQYTQKAAVQPVEKTTLEKLQSLQKFLQSCQNC